MVEHRFLINIVYIVQAGRFFVTLKGFDIKPQIADMDASENDTFSCAFFALWVAHNRKIPVENVMERAKDAVRAERVPVLGGGGDKNDRFQKYIVSTTDRC